MLCDTMGLDGAEGAGLCMDDIPHILKGCMPDRYQDSLCGLCLRHQLY
uniref:Interferon induced protein 44 like n=1 Tax=Homo sapiens TaxID=9606 RepID=A0A7P0Z4K2_HUMAN